MFNILSPIIKLVSPLAINPLINNKPAFLPPIFLLLKSTALVNPNSFNSLYASSSDLFPTITPLDPI